MRKLLISVALTALFAVPSLAQPDHDRGGDRGGGGGQPHAAPAGGGRPDHGGGGPRPGPAPSRGPGGGAPHRPVPAANPAFTRGPNGGGSNRPAPAANPAFTRGPNGGGSNRPAPAANPAFNRGPNGGGNFHGGPGGGRPAPGVNRPGNGGPRRDFRSFGQFHQAFNAQRRFRAPAYRRPPGWYARRWTFGEILPAAFWAQDYWLSNYVDYALPPPPYGATWVRYGDDALLIDEDSGEIITVEYGVFY
jgi:Ni/Co efflux regulator RcnB